MSQTKAQHINTLNLQKKTFESYIKCLQIIPKDGILIWSTIASMHWNRFLQLNNSEFLCFWSKLSDTRCQKLKLQTEEKKNYTNFWFFLFLFWELNQLFFVSHFFEKVCFQWNGLSPVWYLALHLAKGLVYFGACWLFCHFYAKVSQNR